MPEWSSDEDWSRSSDEEEFVADDDDVVVLLVSVDFIDIKLEACDRQVVDTTELHKLLL